jgi:hypothetical protein
MWFFGSFLYGNNLLALLIQSATANINFSLYSTHQRRRCPFRRSFSRAQYEILPARLYPREFHI